MSVDSHEEYSTGGDHDHDSHDHDHDHHDDGSGFIHPGYFIERAFFLSIFATFAVVFLIQIYIRVRYAIPKQHLFEIQNVKAVNQLSGFLSTLFMIITWTDINSVFFDSRAMVLITRSTFLAAFVTLQSAVVLHVWRALNSLQSFESKMKIDSNKHALTWNENTVWMVGGLTVPWVSLFVTIVVMDVTDRSWPYVICEAVTSTVIVATGVRMLMLVKKAEQTLLMDSLSSMAEKHKASLRRWERFAMLAILAGMLAIASTIKRAHVTLGDHFDKPLAHSSPQVYNFWHKAINVSWTIAYVLFLIAMAWYAWADRAHATRANSSRRPR